MRKSDKQQNEYADRKEQGDYSAKIADIFTFLFPPEFREGETWWHGLACGVVLTVLFVHIFVLT